MFASLKSGIEKGRYPAAEDIEYFEFNLPRLSDRE
jgi:hypothetical protein